uniref:DUF5641 domain-containing protein n=1 Tax=Phlebotomus papatasi TaxID=29031 RepID=A0A1B0D849_PHLPP
MVFRTRGGIVSAVTRVQNYINGLSDASDEEINFIGYKANLISQLNLVKAMKAKYIGIQDDIIKGLPDGATKEAEIVSKEDFIERCDDLISQIDTLILEAPQSSSDDSKRDPLSTSDMAKFFTAFITQAEQRHQQQMELLLSTLTNTASTNDTNTYCKTTKLPQTKLPTFDGKHASWKSFKDRFTSSVINVPNISNVQKLDYLMSAVSGNAEACIKKLSMTDENFAVAWKILEDKFDDKNEIVSEYIKTFFAMPRMSSSGAQAIQEITNVFTECTMALDAMDVSQKDPWLIQYTLDRLDSESRVLWGRQCGTEVPTVNAFIKFLDQRCKDVKNSSSSSNKPSSNTSQNSRPNKPQLPKRQATALTNSANASSCRCCSESSHPLYKCPKFLNQTPGERFETVKTLSLCRNCFATHLTHSCTYHKCRKCQGRHNILLHDKYASDSSNRTDPASSSANSASNSGSPSSNHTSDSSAVVAVCASSESDHSDLPPRVFLATALVNILTANGEMIPCRIILDGGAQVNIMTSDLAQRLNLPRFASRLSIAGVNSTRSRARFYVNATILSRTSDTQFTLKCFVLPSVAGNIPNWPVDTSMLHIPHEVALADPDWAVQRPVDLLICGNHYWASWLTDSIRLGPGLPILKETVFGHVVVGEQEPIPPPESFAFTATALDQSIRRFWEIEDASEPTSGTDDQIAAENHFASTHQRNEDGRFIVQLPFREDPHVLGESRPLAIRQFLALERRFITPKERRQQGILSPEELNKALERLIFMDQSENFPGVAGNILSRGRITLSQFKSLSALTPFVDFGGLIRVGGRLENSDMPFQSKHPLLLPKSPLTKLIVRNEHLKQCHAGPSLLLATLRQRFWPLSGRNVVRKIVHDCIRCTRANPRPLQQLMGDLPQHRVTLDRPFQITGICQQRAQHFGKKFRLLYLNTLQQRSKWRHNQQNVKVGEVILFLDETQSGSKWVLGQVSAVHPGKDGKVRVLTIRTPRGTYTRAITKTARLSLDGNILCSNQS